MTHEMKTLAKDWLWEQVMVKGRIIDDGDVGDYLDGLRQQLNSN